ncbi:MAG TPA: TonB-dependent receptor [Gemmatimonadales bacterium]|nr:TonB-dependent receptor [Gemmatimonadales bacterium]
MRTGTRVHDAGLALAGAAVLTLWGASLSAQALTSTVQGRVNGASRGLLASVHVSVVGTPLGAITRADGTYRITGVPPGRYTIRAAIDSLSAEAVDVAVHAGETRTVDLVVGSPGAPGRGRERALDQPTSRTFIDEAALHDLPITTPRGAIALETGVTDVGSPQGVSLRGSDPAGTGTFVDGAPVRNGQRGEVDLVLGTNGIAEAAVTTGVLDAGIGNAEGGAISYLTPSGAGGWRGSVRYRSDYPGFDAWQNVGLNLLEARLRGPITGRLTFFTAATLTGQQSLETQKGRDTQAPVYVMGGVDTVVQQPRTWGMSPTDTTAFQVPQFIEYTGNCDASQNYGVDCQGLRVPYTANGSFSWQGKLQQTYGVGSLFSITGIASRAQQRNFPGQDIYNPLNYTGASLSSYAAIANWRQALSQGLALEVNASYQSDRRSSGPLENASELDSRDPFGGFLVAPLHYVTDFSTTHTVQILTEHYSDVHYLDDRQIQCLLAGEGACQDNVPFLNDNSLNSVQPYRLNPYAAEQSNRLSLWTGGMDNPVDLSQETRLRTRVSVDWLSRGAGRFRAGGEVQRFEAARYDAQGMNSSLGLDAYREQPVAAGAFLEDRLDLGDVVIVGGVRYDYYDSRASYPFTPGRISTRPALPSDSVCYPAGETRPTGVPECGILPGATEPFDPLDPTASFVRAPSHSTWSPRIQFLYSLNPRSDFRFSYGRQAQVPPYDLLFAHKNTDLSIGTAGTAGMVFGQDIGFTITMLTELGFRHLFGRGTLLDVAGYYKGLLAQPVIRLAQVPDPAQPAGPRNEYNTRSVAAVTLADLGHVNGVDARLDHRVSDVFTAMLGYTYQSPSSLEVDARQAFAGAVHLATPAAWHPGSLLGALLANSSAFLTFRFTNGERYTQVAQQGAGYTLEDFPVQRTEDLGASRMPWTSTLDLRLTRAFRVARVNARLFLETTNLVNVTNMLNRFTETNADTNPTYRRKFIDEQTALLQGEASSAGILTGTTIDFTALPGGCAGWQGRNNGNFSSGPVDCVLLEGAERRFGNGDGVYTQAEYQNAFGAWYDFLNAPYNFSGPGRRIRIGAEIVF